MRQRTLGQGLSVTELGLGCMGMSQSYGTPDDVESAATIDRAIELGCLFFDTAEAYGPFTNEILLGRCLQVVLQLPPLVSRQLRMDEVIALEPELQAGVRQPRVRQVFKRRRQPEGQGRELVFLHVAHGAEVSLRKAEPMSRGTVVWASWSAASVMSAA